MNNRTRTLKKREKIRSDQKERSEWWAFIRDIIRWSLWKSAFIWLIVLILYSLSVCLAFGPTPIMCNHGLPIFIKLFGVLFYY